MHHQKLMAITALFIFFQAFNARAESESIRLSVGTTPMTNIFSKIAGPFEADTGIKLVFVQSDPRGHGSELVYRDVDEGRAEGGAGGTSWENWQQILAEKKYQPKNPSEIKYRVIGGDEIQVVSHTKAASALTLEQIQKIFSGEINNLNGFGGDDVKIEIVLSPKQTATQAFFESKVVKKKIAGSNVKVLSNDSTVSDMLKYIATHPGAYGFVPRQAVTGDVLAPKHPTIGRPITFIFRSTAGPSPKIEKLLKYIKDKTI